MTDCEYNVRKALSADAPAIAALEHECIDCPWTESQISDEIADSAAIFLVAVRGGELCGYVSGRVTVDECEISNIAVAQKYRRQGIGRALFSALFGELTLRAVKCVFLLVRDGNIPAVALYTGLGFTQVGLRKNYFKGQNAIIMRRTIT